MFDMNAGDYVQSIYLKILILNAQEESQVLISDTTS